MNNFRKLLVRSLSIVVLTSAILTPTVYATTYKLSLDEAMDMAVAESSDYRALKSTEETVNQQLRQAEFGVSMTAFSREKYYEFIDMYYREPGYDDDDENDGGQVDRDDIENGEVVGPFYFQHLIDMDQSRLMEYYAQSMASLASETNSPSYIAKVMEEEKFIMYLLQFGNDQPGLTREDKFYKFIKTEELTKIQGENGLKKFENGLQAIQNAVSAGASQLYMQYYSAQLGLELTEDNLIFQRKMFEDVEQAYNLGQISEVDYQKQKMSLEIEELKLKQLELDVNTLQVTFNKMLGLPLDSKVLLSVSDLEENDVKGSVADVYENNLDLANLQLDLNYSEREFELMEAYLDLDDYHQDYEDTKDLIVDYKSEYQRIQDNLTVNYEYALQDLYYKSKKMDSDKLALDLAKKEYENGQLMYGLGLLKISDLNGLGLQYMSSNMTYSNAQIAYDQALANMELLVNYGVEYK